VRPRPEGAAGFSLVEVMVAAVIAVIAVIGLAYSFGLGRGMIYRFEAERVALGVAQARLETLSALPPTDPGLTVGLHPGTPLPFTAESARNGTEQWRVDVVDDPLTTPATDDLRQVTVMVSFDHAGIRDTVSLTRLFPKP
jgi:type II secretory pathway pseudopilin PulG